MDFKEFDVIIANNEDKRQALLPCLHLAQETEGHVSQEVMTYLSEKVEIARSEIYSIVTFYGMFSTEKHGKYIIRVCNSLSCYMQKANDILEAIMDELKIQPEKTTEDGLFTLEVVGCLALCDKSPAIMINEKEFGNLTPEKAREIINDYRKGN